MVGCDDLTDADLDALVTFHKERGALATIGLIESDEVDQYGVVITDERGRIVEFQEKPPKGTERSKLVNTGIYVLRAGDLRLHSRRTFYDFGKERLSGAARGGRGLLRHAARWRVLARHRHAGRIPSGDRRRARGPVRLRGARATGIPADVRLGNDVVIEGDVRLGNNVQVGRRVRIVGPTVIGDNVRIGDEVLVERSILWDAVTLGDAFGSCAIRSWDRNTTSRTTPR